MHDRKRNKSVSVDYGNDDRFIWAYDFSFGILILEALFVAAERRQPEGAGEVLDGLRACHGRRQLGA